MEWGLYWIVSNKLKDRPISRLAENNFLQALGADLKNLYWVAKPPSNHGFLGACPPENIGTKILPSNRSKIAKYLVLDRQKKLMPPETFSLTIHKGYSEKV